MKYFAKSNEEEHIVEMDAADPQGSITLNGRSVQVELRQIGAGNLYSLMVNHRSHELFVEKSDGTYFVSINGQKVAVEIEDEKSRQLRRLIKTDEKNLGQTQIKSPMPGLVVQINVSEGQEINKDDSLLIIEAMKMENEIRATSDGTVKKVMTKEGASVDKDSVLLIVE